MGYEDGIIQTCGWGKGKACARGTHTAGHGCGAGNGVGTITYNQYDGWGDNNSPAEMGGNARGCGNIKAKGE